MKKNRDSHPNLSVGASASFYCLRLGTPVLTKLVTSCSKLTIETIEQGVKKVQS